MGLSLIPGMAGVLGRRAGDPDDIQELCLIQNIEEYFSPGVPSRHAVIGSACKLDAQRPRHVTGPTADASGQDLPQETNHHHAWTNGFVERLQGTILHEHWRVAFRRRYFTRAHQLQRSLAGFLRCESEERPHQGYRTQGRTPTQVFWGAAAHGLAKED